MTTFQAWLPLAALAMLQGPPPDEHELAQATVRLETVSEILGKKVIGDGSGFWVDEGLVATARHLVRGCGSVLVVTGDGLILPVRGIAADDPEHDLALLDVLAPEGVARPLALAGIPLTAEGLRAAALAGDARLAQLAPVLLPARVPTDAPASSPPTTWFEFAVRSGRLATIRDADPFGGTLCLALVVRHGDSGSPILSATTGEVLGALTFMHEFGNGRFHAYAAPALHVHALREKARATKTVPIVIWHRREGDSETSFLVGLGYLCGRNWSDVIDHVERYRAHLRDQGDPEELRMPLEGWLRLAFAHSVLAITGPSEDREGHFLAEEQAARRALATEPANATEAVQKPTAYFHLGEALLGLGRIEEAREPAAVYATLVSEDPTAHWLNGCIAAHRGEFDAARGHLDVLRRALGDEHVKTRHLQRLVAERSRKPDR